MPQLERYLLSRLMGLFGFFALVLVSVYWVNRAVLLFDQLIGDGQTAWVVLQFTLLTLPNVIRLVLPVAAFAATIYAITRLASDSELVVMQAAGASPWRLGRPVLVFGFIVALMMSALTHVLVPLSRAELSQQQAEIAENISAQFLNEGSFQHPADGITIYIREISEHGELRDMFLSDDRNPDQEVIYTADKALIVRSATGPKLVMFDGMVQTLRTVDNSLAVTRFADFTYNIGALMGPAETSTVPLENIPSWQLIFPSAELLATTNTTAAQVWNVLNERITQPLRAPALAILGFAALMIGGYSRFGMGRQVALAVAGLVALQFLSNLMDSMMRGKPELWCLSYVPILAGFAGAAVLLYIAGRRRTTRGSVS